MDQDCQVTHDSIMISHVIVKRLCFILWINLVLLTTQFGFFCSAVSGFMNPEQQLRITMHRDETALALFMAAGISIFVHFFLKVGTILTN